ncbi:hypothetical protein TPSD3_00810 [Thioflexithrix psekupsensis]|uniref:DNA-binding protein H-NS-like C-terminal domain-containing protein n=1 Tax=Thioflexithrix psekupsensis TaxID=1570016 RepID=A0A251XC78_9GAMM|nr:hypothetical protein TPSD3_00810 [Thioflexithrix psekupsensis]
MVKQLQSLTTAELVEVKKLTEKLILQAQKDAKSELKTKIRKMAKERGLRIRDLNLDDLGDLDKKPKKPKKVFPVKYRNPQDSNQTWTGLGKQPLWVRACLAEGTTLEQLLVPKS